MDTINITLNKAITVKMKQSLKQKGYNNVSEYIRDLLRRDLHLEEHDRYPYDLDFLEELSREAKTSQTQKRLRTLASKKDLLA
ncbi:MAG: hypothetical protein AAB416_01745 [Patescibacteria group bacterium]